MNLCDACLPCRTPRLMSQRLEDRIKELCAKAVVTPESPELNAILKELQAALAEHARRLRKMVFDGVPLHPERRSPTDEVIDRCAICGKPIMLEQAKVTEDGRPVHGQCYAVK
jgi:formylmethanofuran dehydrogenase subunit E